MNITDHTRIELVEGGTRFKQGDYAELKFAARDSQGKVIDFTGKDIVVSIWNKNKGIIYQSSATFNSELKAAVVVINEVLDYGDFQIEFTATDSTDANYRVKFPSDEYSGLIKITPSTDNMDVVGVQMTTVTQLRNEQTQLQQEFESQVLPRVDTVEVKQTQLETQFTDVVSGVTDDAEILAARTGPDATYPTVGARLDATTTQLAETQNDVNTRVQILSSKVIYTIGPGGTFATINEALRDLSEKYPAYRFNSNDMGIDLLLKSGFVMQEQVFVSDLNLSHFNIKSEDAEVVIDRQRLTTALGSVARYPAWAFSYGAISPKIYALFNMNETGPSEQRNGFNVRLGAIIQMENGSGCKNAYRGLHIANGNGYANGTIFTGSKQAGIRCANSGKIWAEGTDVSGSLIGFMMDEGEVKARYAKADNCDTAIRAVSSELDFKFGRALNCGTVLSADEISKVLMSDSDCKNYTSQGLFVTGKCDVVADRIDLGGGAGRALNVNNSDLMARFSKLVPTTDDLSLSATTSNVDITSSTTKRVSTLHGANVNARNVDASAYTAGHAFSLSGVGNDLIIQGSNGTVGFPTNQLVSVGIIHK